LTSRWSGRSNPDEKKHFKESPLQGKPASGKAFRPRHIVTTCRTATA